LSVWLPQNSYGDFLQAAQSDLRLQESKRQQEWTAEMRLSMVVRNMGDGMAAGALTQTADPDNTQYSRDIQNTAAAGAWTALALAARAAATCCPCMGAVAHLNRCCTTLQHF
jgi:hypothetical protein